MITQQFMTATELNEKLIGLVKHERRITQEILSHILLFQKCSGYLKLGYSSLHQYLTRGLGYSDDQAYRRIKAAQLMNQLPEIADKLQSAKLNLSQMATAQNAFETSERETKVPVSKELKTRLIASLENTTNYKTKSILNTELKLMPKTEEKINPQSDHTVRMEFSLTGDQFEKLQKIKSLISHQVPDLKTAGVLEVVFDFFISKKQSVSVVSAQKNTYKKMRAGIKMQTEVKTEINTEVKAEIETKVEAETKVETKAETETNTKTKPEIKSVEKETQRFMETRKNYIKNNSEALQSKINKKSSRYITVAVKNELYKKSNGCCEYVGPTGIRCGSRYKIQIDHHPKAFCFGGESNLENLRHLCSQHNLMTACESGIGFENTSGLYLGN